MEDAYGRMTKETNIIDYTVHNEIKFIPINEQRVSRPSASSIGVFRLKSG